MTKTLARIAWRVLIRAGEAFTAAAGWCSRAAHRVARRAWP